MIGLVTLSLFGMPALNAGANGSLNEILAALDLESKLAKTSGGGECMDLSLTAS